MAKIPGAKIRVAIVGVGNCASSLIQGIEFYRGAAGEAPIPGLMHLDLGGYHVGDIECVAAFDIARGKVGRDLAEAILAPPNNTSVARRAAVRLVTAIAAPRSSSAAARPTARAFATSTRR